MKIFCKAAGLIAIIALTLSWAEAGAKSKKAIECEPQVTIVPNPKSIMLAGSEVKLPKKGLTVSINDKSLEPASEYLTDVLNGYGVTPKIASNDDDAAIILSIVEPDSTLSVKGSYRFRAENDCVTIEAVDFNGITNGISTLRQLLPAPTVAAKKSNKPLLIPAVEIADAPDYWWRGLHLDSSRHFWTIPEVEQYLDLMALYKMSVFHWHLIDDQGWRVQIDRYPELTKKGGWRVFNSLDSACERASLKDASMRIPRDRMRPGENGDSVYGGFYTKEQLRHIVNYAAQRGIEVIPEFDVPGHSTILTVVHPEIACGGIPNSSVCPGKDQTLELCKNVYTEIFEIFPSKYVHMGGDEVDKTRWKQCPDCARRMKEYDMDSADELQAWFVRQMELFFRNNNRTLIGWDEITYDGLGAETAIMWWTAGTPEVVAEATRQGKHVTCTPTSCMYFDYPQTDAEVAKILSLNPRERLSSKQQKLINGLQGNVWTEYIPTTTRIQTQIFPRMIALSESAWNADPSRRISVDEFWKRLPAHLSRFDAMGIAYRQPDCLPQIKPKNSR
ncbi:MAG: beta-N-acetylhexosaminidase [Muribaculum sp.]|nr:beta-N-acetylhexosaminidase [Muribaculaceae bacterium]MCM1080819.1 beta-N-acetylhexosaminidase [Muribaculum sp.]